MQRRLWQWLALAVLLVGAIAAAGGVLWWTGPPILEVYHAPSRFARRAGDLSANICGAAFRRAQLRYRLNGGDWCDLVQDGPRAPRPWWTLELLPSALRPGRNEVLVEASAPLRATQVVAVEFDYEPAAVALPHLADWSGELDVQDGRWEVVEDGGGRRVRPVPGTEHYDRILLVTGAFAGGRRVETEMVFRSFVPDRTVKGFGVLTLWGGHADEPGVAPRRGWLYAIAWHMQPYGAWCEFSVKQGGEPRADAFAGATQAPPRPGERLSLIAECWPEVDAGGRHLGYRQRMKLWPSGTPEPELWLECADRGGARLPEREYAVALVAHECQVEFGPVLVQPLSPRVQEPPAAPR